MSLPTGIDPDGRPIGVQLGGAPYGEAELIGLAAGLEFELTWHDRRPQLHTGRLHPAP